MGRFAVGMIVGIGIGVAATAAADIVVADGRLFHWTVTKDNAEVCKHPYVWRVERQIEC